ncbi:hypothetical protein QU487_18845 [Crenobacter sp. SG2305]|uniref:hypothetical protein n=1 Tax=Crenobacter oryzisoli TaxID=3056844 RepID=UPI0025AB437B|nr:hypothetical protein [Crenobacter sp. SG2305]MDN0084786.1 hypothetical protein [Crenobacter sp. SG2305]
MNKRVYFCLPLVVALGGCNWIGSMTGLSAGSNKALGAACRQTGRSLEECFMRNEDADKAQLYAGWREMNEYMAKNRLATMAPPPQAADSKTANGTSNGALAPIGARAVAALEPQALTNDAADKAAQNDPEVRAVLQAIGKGEPRPANKPVASKMDSAAPAPAVPPATVGEADQRRLLNIIDELNKKPGGGNAKG